jgi:putative NADH-flavin reductase
VKVLVAGASGALGSRLVPRLIDAGHEVIGTHNSPTSAELLRTLGARPVMVDLLDACAVRTAVLENEPEAIVHEATALANAKFRRSMDKVLAKTSELRTKGTDALLAAAREAGVRRFVAQSFASSRYARGGGPIKTEDDPLDPAPPKNFQRTAAALTYLERVVTDFGGLALRYGVFYGAANDAMIEPVMLAEARGASNAKAKRELGWTLRHPSWRQGFVEAFAKTVGADIQAPIARLREGRPPAIRLSMTQSQRAVARPPSHQSAARQWRMEIQTPLVRLLAHVPCGTIVGGFASLGG